MSRHFSQLRKANFIPMIRSGFWYTASAFAEKALAFISVPIFTRLLNVGDYGTVSFFQSLVGILAILSGLNLDASIGIAKQEKKDVFHVYVSSLFLFSLIWFIAEILLLSLWKTRVERTFGISISLAFCALLSGYGSFIFNSYSKYLMFENRYRLRSVLPFLRAAAEILVSVVLLLTILKGSFWGRVIGSLSLNLIFGLGILWAFWRKYTPRLSGEYWRYGSLIGAPLIPHSLSHLILSYFDRIAIKALVGNVATGLYGFAYNIGMIPLLLLSSTNSAWVPWFYDALTQEKHEEIRVNIRRYNAAFFLFILLLLTVSPEIARLLAPPEYMCAIKVIPIIIFSYYLQFIYTCYVNFSFFYKKTGLISTGTIIAGVINMVLNYKMIPVFGYEIAAWTTVFSYACLLFFHWFNVSVLIKAKGIRAMDFSLTVLLGLSLSCALYWGSPLMGFFSQRELVFRYTLFLAMLGFMAILHRKEIRKILDRWNGADRHV